MRKLKKELFWSVKSKEKLAIITDEKEIVIWDSEASPVSALYKAYCDGTLSEKTERMIYANQAGMAIAAIAPQLHIKKCYAYQLSECGLKAFEKNKIPVEYEMLIPLVKSSKDNNEVCPIERFLSEHSEEEGWNYLRETFNGEEVST